MSIISSAWCVGEERRMFVFIDAGSASNAPQPHTIALLSNQSRQVNCLVEMAPSAPSSRPPRHGVSSTASQAGENDQTNVATKRSFQAFSTYPTLTRSRRRRIAPSDPSLNQPSRQSLAECLERPNSSKTFTNLNNSLNREPNE